MVQVDYETIDLLLQARKMSRRQLAKLIGVSPDTFAGSFRRESKMKEFQVWQIAHILSVNPIDLLKPNSNGQYNEEDIKKIESEKFVFEFESSEDEIGEITVLLEKLNPKGLQIIKTIASALCQVDDLKASYTMAKAYHSGEGYLSKEDLEELHVTSHDNQTQEGEE